MHMCVHTCMCTCMRVCMCTYVHTCVHACVHACVHVCACVCVNSIQHLTHFPQIGSHTTALYNVVHVSDQVVQACEGQELTC